MSFLFVVVVGGCSIVFLVGEKEGRNNGPQSFAFFLEERFAFPLPNVSGVRSMGDQSGYFILGIHLEGTGLVGRFRVL